MRSIRKLRWRSIDDGQWVALTRGGEFVITRDMGPGPDFLVSYELVYFDEETEDEGLDYSFNTLQEAKDFAQGVHEEDFTPSPEELSTAIAPFIRLGYNQACNELRHDIQLRNELTPESVMEKLDEMIHGTRKITGEDIYLWLKHEEEE